MHKLSLIMAPMFVVLKPLQHLTLRQMNSSFIALYLLQAKFIEKLKQDIPRKGVKQQLAILCSIYALHLIHKHLNDFISTGCVTSKQASLAREQLRSLYSQVRPNAIALVDAFIHRPLFGLSIGPL